MMHVSTIKRTTLAIASVVLGVHLFMVIQNDVSTLGTFLIDLSFILVEYTLFMVYFQPHLLYKWKAKLMKLVRRGF